MIYFNKFEIRLLSSKIIGLKKNYVLDVSILNLLDIQGEASTEIKYSSDPALTTLITSMDEGICKPGLEVVVLAQAAQPQGLGVGLSQRGAVVQKRLTLSDMPMEVDGRSYYSNARPMFSPQRLQHLGAFDQQWLQDLWPMLPAEVDSPFFLQTGGVDDVFPSTLLPDHIQLSRQDAVWMECALPGKQYQVDVVFKDAKTIHLGAQDVRMDTVYLLPDGAKAAVVYRARCPVQDSDADDIASVTVRELGVEVEAAGANLAADAPMAPDGAAWAFAPAAASASASASVVQEEEPASHVDVSLSEAAAAMEHAALTEKPQDTALDAELDAEVEAGIQEMLEQQHVLEAQTQELLDEYGLTRADIAQALEQNPELAHLANLFRDPEAQQAAALAAANSAQEAALPEVDVQALQAQTQALHTQTEALLEEYGLSREDIAQALEQDPQMAHLADFMRHSGAPEFSEGVQAEPLPSAGSDAADAVAEPNLQELEAQLQAMEAQTDALLQEYGLTREVLAEQLAQDPATAHLAGLLTQAPAQWQQARQELQAQMQQAQTDQVQAVADASAEGVETIPLDAQKNELSALDTQALEAKNTENLKVSAASADAEAWPHATAGAEGIAGAAQASQQAAAEQAASTAALTREEVQRMLAAQQPLAGCDVSGLDLSQLCFDGVDLRGVNAAQTSFNQCSMRGAVLDGALLQESTWVAADLTQASLQGCTAAQAVFTSAVLAQANLREADCSGANFDHAVLTEAQCDQALFGKASWLHVQATGLRAPQASFAEAVLTSANLQQACLQQADFSEAVCEATCFAQAQCAQAQFFGTQARHADFRGADLGNTRVALAADFSGAQLQAARLDKANWAGVQLAQAHFDGAQLDQADFTHCQAVAASFRLATARHTRLSKMDLRQADLTGVNLFKGSLRKSNLEQTTLHHANLYGVDFEATQPTWASLQGANIAQTMLQFRPPLH